MEQISRRTLLTALGVVGTTSTLAACADDDPSGTETVDVDATHYVDGDDAEPADGTGSESPSEDSSTTSGTAELVEVDLDGPDDLRDRWAAFAAMWVGAAVSSGPGGPRVEGGDWVYEMELGQWAYLVRYKDGRAVLAGSSSLNITRDAKGEKEARAALVAAGPSWWGIIDDVLPASARVGFVMGWDGSAWSRASDAPTGGGFDDLIFYLESKQFLGEQLVKWGSKGTKTYEGSAKAAADLVMKAGPNVTVSQLKRLGPGMQSSRLKQAVSAAKAFDGKGKH